MAYISGGLDEIQQLRAEIERIKQALEEMQPQLEKMPQQVVTFRELERLALRWLVVARRLGLPEDVDAVINKISRIIVMIRMGQMAISMMLSTNPVTAAIGVAGLIGTSMSSVDLMAGY